MNTLIQIGAPGFADERRLPIAPGDPAEAGGQLRQPHRLLRERRPEEDRKSVV